MAEYLISPNDIPDLIESIIEAFQETDKVSAKLLADKMSQKTGRVITYQNASYLYTMLGFVATPIENTAERYLVRNDEIINRFKSRVEALK